MKIIPGKYVTTFLGNTSNNSGIGIILNHLQFFFMLMQIIMYIISISSIALGFVALLKQKTYIDSETKEPTEVEVPFLGKIKTNYPALVFVFLGFAAALFTFQKSATKEKVRWRIQGQMVDTTHRIDDWREGEFKIIPENSFAIIDKNTGAYTIEMDIDKDQSFEDAVKCIIYSHKLGTIQLCPSEEFINKSNGKPSFLISNTNPTRFYKPVLLTNFFLNDIKNERDNVYNSAHYVNQ